MFLNYYFTLVHERRLTGQKGNSFVLPGAPTLTLKTTGLRVSHKDGYKNNTTCGNNLSFKGTCTK